MFSQKLEHFWTFQKIYENWNQLQLQYNIIYDRVTKNI